MLLPGNEHEVKTAHAIVDNVKNKIILADRGYDSDEFRKFVSANGGVALVPGKVTEEAQCSTFLKSGESAT